jgi:serine kinase of HPr protein (carbohydrate metabolism regulator)
MTAADNVHGTGIVVDGTGILLRGPSGSGKSILALLLMDEMEGRLVADDRIDLFVHEGELMMSAPAPIAGKIELRGFGIVERPYVQQAAVHLVIDLVPALERMPEDSAFRTTIMGVTLARCPVPQAGVVPPMHQVLLVRDALRHAGSGHAPARQKTT